MENINCCGSKLQSNAAIFVKALEKPATGNLFCIIFEAKIKANKKYTLHCKWCIKRSTFRSL